jgi:hypothetical protein
MERKWWIISKLRVSYKNEGKCQNKELILGHLGCNRENRNINEKKL